MGAALKTAVAKWSKTIGHKEAVRRLVMAGASVALADKICRGTYGPMPKYELCVLINGVMSADPKVA